MLLVKVSVDKREKCDQNWPKGSSRLRRPRGWLFMSVMLPPATTNNTADPTSAANNNQPRNELQLEPQQNILKFGLNNPSQVLIFLISYLCYQYHHHTRHIFYLFLFIYLFDIDSDTILTRQYDNSMFEWQYIVKVWMKFKKENNRA